MEKRKSGYEQFVEAPSHRQLVEQESLILEATEFLSLLMDREGVNRVELARRLGRSKAYVTQVLRGGNNLTLRTLADLGTALGYRFRFLAKNSASGRWVTLPDAPQPSGTRHESLLPYWRASRVTPKQQTDRIRSVDGKQGRASTKNHR